MEYRIPSTLSHRLGDINFSLGGETSAGPSGGDLGIEKSSRGSDERQRAGKIADVTLSSPNIHVPIR
jgi:hypothetical protein